MCVCVSLILFRISHGKFVINNQKGLKEKIHAVMIAVLQDNICATNLDLEYKP